MGTAGQAVLDRSASEVRHLSPTVPATIADLAPDVSPSVLADAEFGQPRDRAVRRRTRRRDRTVRVRIAAVGIRREFRRSRT